MSEVIAAKCVIVFILAFGVWACISDRGPSSDGIVHNFFFGCLFGLMIITGATVLISAIYFLVAGESL